MDHLDPFMFSLLLKTLSRSFHEGKVTMHFHVIKELMAS